MTEENFFDKYYWCPVILTTILCFGFTLTNPAMGVDDPTSQFVWYIEGKVLLQQGRWGYELISLFVNISGFLPCWLDFLAVLVYLLTSVVWVKVFIKASDNKFDKISAIIFTCLYISFPYLSLIFIYMSADLCSAFNMLFASLSVWFTLKVFECQKGRKKNFILAIICIAIGYGFYESTMIYFACGIMIALFLIIMCRPIEKFRIYILRMLTIFGIMLGGFGINRIILSLIRNYYNVVSNNYLNHYLKYDFKSNLVIQIWNIAKELINAIFIGDDLVNFTLRISMILIFLVSICVAINKRNIVPVIIGIGVIISNFALIIGTGDMEIMYDDVQNKKRMLVTYGLFTSFSISLIYSLVTNIKQEKIKKIIKYIIVAGVVILVLKQSREMIGIFWADYQRASLDQQKAGFINYEVEKTDWKNKPVIFAGYSDDYIATKDKDPLSSYFHFFGNWTDLEYHNYISFYMDGLGHVYPMGGIGDVYPTILEEGIMEQALQNSIQQPSYPMDGYVTEYEHYIIVKLGEHEEN